MGTIRLNKEELEARARLLDEKRQIHLENLSQIISSINELESSWEGMAKTGFFDEFRRMQEPMKNFANILEAFSAHLNRTAIDFTQTDESHRTVNGLG